MVRGAILLGTPTAE